jgi:autotransporter-associated beta strand protein
LTKTDGGLLTLESGFNYTGLTFIGGGTLQLGTGVSVGDASLVNWLSNDTTVRTIEIGLGAQLWFNVKNNLTFPNLI